MATNKGQEKTQYPEQKKHIQLTCSVGCVAQWQLHVNSTYNAYKGIFQVNNKLKARLCLFFLERFIYLATW